MARIEFIAFVCLTTLAGQSLAKTGWWSTYGMDLSVKSFDAVCWYETAKIFPTVEKVKEDYQCGGMGEQIRSQIPDGDDNAKTYFGMWFKQMPMTTLPSEYGDNCNKYLDNADMKEPSDESDALNDPNSGNAFIYKGFAYCLMNTLRKRQGQQAIEDVKNEKTHMMQHWITTLLKRDNEYRDRHGVPQVKLLKELVDGAQSWADTNANECHMYHSDSSIRQYKGEYVGENVFSGEGNDTTYIPYTVSNGWYSEIKQYPFPSNCDSRQAAGMPCGTAGGAVGHFTQTVWKRGKYVGYGYAYSQQCKKWFVVGRYYPGGNVGGMYADNVVPVVS